MNIAIEFLWTSCSRMLGLSVVESLVVITNFAFRTTAIFYSYSSSYVVIHLFICFAQIFSIRYIWVGGIIFLILNNIVFLRLLQKLSRHQRRRLVQCPFRQNLTPYMSSLKCLMWKRKRGLILEKVQYHVTRRIWICLQRSQVTVSGISVFWM